MKVSRLRLILAYLLTIPALSAGFLFNGIPENDCRGSDMAVMAGVFLLAALIVAFRRFGQGLSAAWYLNICLAMVAYTAVLVAVSALASHLGTPSILMFSGFLAACSVGLLDRR
jgi:hypothetical protein